MPKHPPPRNPLQLRTNGVTNGPHCLVHGFRHRGVDERPFTVCLRHVADALFDLRFDLGVLYSDESSTSQRKYGTDHHLATQPNDNQARAHLWSGVSPVASSPKE